MAKVWLLLTLGVLFAAMGCTTQNEFLDNKQPIAIQTAVERARFALNCPAANGTVLSREVVQPGLQGPLVSGIQRAEFTIGVEGCGERKTYVVVCPEGGEGCFATGPGAFLGR